MTARDRLFRGVLSLTLIGGFVSSSALSNGEAAASTPKRSSVERYPTCGEPKTAKTREDRQLLRRYCANSRKALSYSTMSLPRRALTLGEASVPATGFTESQDADTYTTNNGDGTITAAEYELGTLVLNTPTDGDFDPTLPVGVVALDETVARSRLNARVSRVSPDAAPLDVGGGLTIVGSGCSTVWSGTPHDSSNAKMDLCAAWYKPTDGDGDPDKNYRVIATNSTSRGGNGAHVLEQATTRNEITQGNVCCDWSPNDCCIHPDGGTTVHWSINLTPGGLGGTVSGDYTFWPDTFGLRYFDLPSDKVNYGWRGGAQCCQLFGGDGGVDFSYNQGGNYSFNTVPFIQWHN